jgi:hypothetical protein
MCIANFLLQTCFQPQRYQIKSSEEIYILSTVFECNIQRDCTIHRKLNNKNIHA